MRAGQFKVKITYGHSELKQFNKFENGRMVTYGYRVDYDLSGTETGRTEPEPLVFIGWDNGAPFTETDYCELNT